MFRNKRVRDFEADTYFNVYNGCNVGCKFCKFNKQIVIPTPNVLDECKLSNKRVLVSYSSEPLPFDDCTYTINIINRLHSINASILFLTRMTNRLIKILDCFKSGDIVGVSISENLDNDIESIEKFFDFARGKGLETWISLEPVETYEFASEIITKFKDKATYIRVGKLDCEIDNTLNFSLVANALKNTYNNDNIYIKI